MSILSSEIDSSQIGHVGNIEIKNPVYVGINCHVGKNVTLGPFVSLGNDDVCIDNNVKLESSLVLDNSNIDLNQIISNSVVDSKNNILS